jgi:hypothetical protein
MGDQNPHPDRTDSNDGVGWGMYMLPSIQSETSDRSNAIAAAIPQDAPTSTL